ncbi:MAG: hypothetical protein Q7R22_014125 [Verrucomicrobiota bacterium JB025]|nr:hypothetical protein [Verrucomicrobiota bacterium JB025]
MAFLAKCLICLLAAYGLAFYLAVPANPEVRFWQHVVELRDKEIAEVRTQNPDTPIIFFTGGSSCAFSIDPKIIEQECGLPAFNLGLPVAAGAEYLAHQAMAKARAGDILVLCLEPDLLAADDESPPPTRFSFAISSVTDNPLSSAGYDTFPSKPGISDYLTYSRPGAGHLATLAAKTMAGKGYRYSISDSRYHGRMETQIHDASLRPRGTSPYTKLTVRGRKFLETFKGSAHRRKINLYYSMPWHFTAGEALEETRKNRLSLIAEIKTIIPVIRDGAAGATSTRQHYSDSQLHLTSDGSSLRSRNLARAMKECISTTSSTNPE